MCARLGSLNNTCVEYFEAEGVEILQLLEKEIVNNKNFLFKSLNFIFLFQFLKLSPETACYKTGLCLKNQIQNVKTPFFDLQAGSPSNCTLCKMIVLEAKSMLLNKKKEVLYFDRYYSETPELNAN